ncbi:MAG: hypothetical protein U9N34_07080, partial [Candidatus Cloacimonadota bacterium]|nr:hypothetical protein [Candidatus Cloacimonadota bacterium]
MKKMLTIIALFTVFSFAFAKISNYNQSNFRSISTKMYGNYPKRSYNYSSGFITNNYFIFEKNNVQIDIDEKLFYSLPSDELRNSQSFNEISTSIFYKRNFSIHNCFTSYAEQKTHQTHLPGIDEKITKNYHNFITTNFQTNFFIFDFEGFLGLRNLDFEKENSDYKDSDLYSKLFVYYNLSDQITLNLNSFIKNDLNNSNYYDYSKIGAGLNLEEFINLNNSMDLIYY